MQQLFDQTMGLDLKLTWRYFPIFPGKNNKESKKILPLQSFLNFLHW